MTEGWFAAVGAGSAALGGGGPSMSATLRSDPQACG